MKIQITRHCFNPIMTGKTTLASISPQIQRTVTLKATSERLICWLLMSWKKGKIKTIWYIQLHFYIGSILSYVLRKLLQMVVICLMRALAIQPITVRHIIDRETIETQADVEKRLIAQLKLHLDMFKDSDPNGLIERAYDIQGDRIAYVETGDRETNGIAAETVREENEAY
jgi:hypothetical protein